MEKEIPISLLMHFCSKKFKNVIRNKCDLIGLNSTYSDIIMLLGRNNGVSQNDICEKLHLAKPTVSLTLRNMESLNLIEKNQDLNDSRKTIVTLTTEGINIDNKIRNLFKETENEMINNINSDELTMFKKILNKMTENLEGEQNV